LNKDEDKSRDLALKQALEKYPEEYKTYPKKDIDHVRY